MIDAAQIRAQLGNVLEATSCEGVGRLVRGKVRDSYLLGDRRLLVVTDRISAFDCVLGTIPFKGQVLNQMAAYWFEATRDLAPNHMLATPDPNVMLVRECEQLPLEFVVRGYITGVTKTSAWAHYAQGGRLFCGHRLPDGLRKDQRLERPIVTPTTKHEHHDRNISRDEAIAEGLIDGPTFDEAEALCLRLYARGVARAAERGLILVDTKYELGRIQGTLVVSDEIHTPDSSRYWYQDSYEARFAAGEEPRKLDKEYVRQWLAARGFRGEGTPPALDDDVRVEAARRYIEAFETITGRAFSPDTRPIGPRVQDAIAAFRSPSPDQEAGVHER